MVMCVQSRRRFYSRLLELKRRIKANSLPLLAAAALTPIVSGGQDIMGGGSTTTTTNTIHSTNNRSRVEKTLQLDDDIEQVVLRVKRYHCWTAQHPFPNAPFFLLFYSFNLNSTVA